MKQPDPIPQGLVESIQHMVRMDLLEREDHGIKEYGTPLQANNGRDALQDAYEEALDLACYLKQAIVERDKNEDFRFAEMEKLLASQNDLINKLMAERDG
jgi:hypothetical protein